MDGAERLEDERERQHAQERYDEWFAEERGDGRGEEERRRGEDDTEPEVRDRVRKTYAGPLALAVDYMVFNVTKDDIRIRMSAIDEEIWPSPPLKKKIAPDTGSAVAFSKFTISGALPFPEVVGPIYDEVNELYGTNHKPLFGDKDD